MRTNLINMQNQAMTYKERKIKSCLKLAREASRDSWQVAVRGSALMKAFRRVSREAIHDARYWRSQEAN